ncbi:MAG: serine hydrolase domain-containing protein [Akkermansiaceae bacterium]
MKILPLILSASLPVLSSEITPLPIAKPERVGMSSDVLSGINTAVDGLVKKKQLAGASVLVIRKGQIVYQDEFGYASRAAKTPVTKETLFRIYSMSKGITSAAALMLHDAGKLDINDPVSKHLPEFKNVTVWQKNGEPVPANPAPTIRDLLRHTAGFSYGWSPHPVDKKYQKIQVLSREKSLEDMSKQVSQFPLLYQPGTKWVYGINTDILGRVVEAASGMKFSDYLRQNLFSPLGMTNTSFHVPQAKAKLLSDVYAGKAGFLVTAEPAVGSPFLSAPKQESGGGGLVSTINDFGRFLQMIASGGTFQGRTYLKKETVALMTTNQLPKDIPAISLGGQDRKGTGFGLGFSVRTGKTNGWDKHAPIGEFGWGGMASTHYWVSPKDELVVVTMEQTLPYNSNLEEALKPIIYQAIIEKL